MGRFVEGTDRGQTTLFPECLEDWICEDNPIRVIEAFVEEVDLAELGFSGVDPEATGRPPYHSNDVTGFILANEISADIVDLTDEDWARKWAHVPLPGIHFRYPPPPPKNVGNEGESAQRG
jgi:hypothetical protein